VRMWIGLVWFKVGSKEGLYGIAGFRNKIEAKFLITWLRGW